MHALTGANGARKIHADGGAVGRSQPLQWRKFCWMMRRFRFVHRAMTKKLGIHLVQQEVDVALVPQLSVAENILLDQLAEPGHVYSWREIRRQARALLNHSK